MGPGSFELEESLIERGVIGAPTRDGPSHEGFIPRGLLLQWHITDACNLRCSHCYQESYSETDSMPYELMKESLAQYLGILSEWGIRGHINFTGGEPLLEGSFFNLLERVYDNSEQLGFAVLTNGTLLDRYNVDQLKKLGCRFVQVSLEGGRSAHDSIRGPGSFDKTIWGLGLLRKAGIPTMVSFTSHRSNAGHFSEVAEICRKNRVDVLWSDRLVPLGAGKAFGASLMRPSEVKTFFDELYRVRESFIKKWFNNTEIRLHRALHFLTLLEHGEKGAKPYKCSAGRSLLTLMPSGLVLPCRRMPIVVGDIGVKYLGDIYRESILLSSLRNFRRCPTGCEGCRFVETCNGGLRCLAYACSGTPFRKDPHCFMEKDPTYSPRRIQKQGDY